MPLTNLIRAKVILDNLWKKVWDNIKSHTFNVSVENQVEFPEFPEFPKIPEVKIPKPIDTRQELKEIINSIEKQTKDLKISPDTSATKKQLLSVLKEMKLLLSQEKEKQDLTPEVIKGILALRKDLSKVVIKIPETDLKPIQAQIEALANIFDFSSLLKFTRYDDIRVFLNEKQLEKLSKSMGTTVATASGGGVIKNTLGVITDANPLSTDIISALPTGTNTIGSVSIKPTTSGGLSISRNLDIDESGDNEVNTACQLYGWYIYNNNAATVYLKLYNDSSAPTVGTDTPVMTIPIPSGSAANVEFTNGIAFSSGLGVGATTGVADNDTGAPDANDVVGNFLYK